MKRAFSLIELSIVILIIGILIAGVTQSSRLINQMRLTSARSITQSSPVASIKGVSIWLEATSENSFLTAEAEDGFNITQWNDLNPQSTSKNNVSRSTSDNKIIYQASSFNSLPALYFDGSASTTANLSGSVLTSVNNAFTFFVVSRSDESNSTTWRAAIRNGAGSGWVYTKTGDNPSRKSITFASVLDNKSENFTANAEIACGTYDGTNIALYVNGLSVTLAANTATVVTPITTFFVGNSTSTVGSSAWKGAIAEVIVFDRALKSEERRSIEAYLGKKWGIKVS